MLLVSSQPELLLGQSGALDLSFNPGTGITTANGNAYILGCDIQSNGKLIIGGNFNSYNGLPINCLARLNTDGSIDTSFQIDSTFSVSLTGSQINEIVVQGDDKIIVAGVFNTPPALGYGAHRVVRLNPDGSLDQSFYTNSGFNNDIWALSIQDDGKILVGGSFTSFDGNSHNRLVRLLDNGMIDPSFNIGSGADNTIEDIAIHKLSGQIIIGGDFTSYNGNTRLRVARLNSDGSLDANFNSMFGAGSVVYSVGVRPNGMVAIGGSFNSYSFQSRNHFAVLNDNATLNGSFISGSAFNREVRELLVLDRNKDGRADGYFLVGDFTSYQLEPANKIALIDTFGLADANFNSGTGVSNNMVHKAVQQDDGRIIITGSFDAYDGISRKGIARIYICETPQPDSIAGSSTTRCPGEILTYAVPDNPFINRYEWTLPSGWSGSSDSASITVTSNGVGGTLSVRAFTDSCGYSISMQKNIQRVLPPETPICLVTVDDSSTHNIVVWGKPQDKSFIDSFLIYRETTTGIYSKIASIHRDSLSEYHDYGANPNTTSYRYKLSVLDTCGVESELSPFHNSIHLQNLGNGNFQWTFYDIENSPNPVTEFNIYRDNFGNGNFTQIGLVPGTNATFTDINQASFPDARYVVDVSWGIACSPIQKGVNTTRSNIRKGSGSIIINDTTNNDSVTTPVDTLVNDTSVIPNDTSTVSVSNSLDLSERVNVYPNPADEFIYFSSTVSIQFNRVMLMNMLGQKVFDYKLGEVSSHGTVNIGHLQKGIYIILLETDIGIVREKIVVK